MTNIHFVSPDEKFEKYQIINNQPYAKHLTQFLDGKAEDGYVLNLNAEWGAGKTTFLQCWYNELKEDHPVVYFDAWKSDFTKDPMLALMDALHQQLISPISKNKELIEQFFSKGSHFVKTALPSLIVGYLKNKGGMDGEDSLLTSVSEEFGITESDLGDALKDTMKAMLNQRNRVEGIEDFKKVLSDLSKNYIEIYPNQSNPVFVLIDELDRCRPTYAIETIECIKHFFNTESFIFVLATDTNQLQHSIKSIYGSKFDSLTYLSRFFDNTVTLPTPNRKDFINTIIYKHLDHEPLHPKVIEFIDVIFEWHETNSLREIQKILNVIDVAQNQDKSYRAIVLIVISLLKKRHPINYDALKNKRTIPYKGRHSIATSENIIEGTQIRFELTSKTSESPSSVLRVATMFQWENKSYKQFDEYNNMKLNGMKIDEVCCALINESLFNKEKDEAKREEYFSLVEFSGFLQR